MPFRHSATLRALTDWRQRSLIRSNTLVLASLLAAFRLSHFPQNNESMWLTVPLLVSLLGTADTLRCMRTRWNWYHGGVVLCAYMDLMVVCLIGFFLIYPLWL